MMATKNMPDSLQKIWAVEVMFHCDKDCDDQSPSEIYEVHAFQDAEDSSKMIRAALQGTDQAANATFILKTLPDGTNSLRSRADVEAFLLESAEPAAPEARANGAN